MKDLQKPCDANAVARLKPTAVSPMLRAPETHPPDSRTPMQIVNIRLPAALVDAVDSLAAERSQQNRSELIRAAVLQYLQRETAEVPATEAERALEVLRRVVRHATVP
jgi:Arc/MetJ-type ribon-helix-helix transcriptional regulator